MASRIGPSDAPVDPLASAGPVDVVAGVHVANQAARIAELLDSVASALETYEPARRTAVLVADAGSQDETASTIGVWCDSNGKGRRACLDVIAPRHRGRAIGALLAAAERLGARAVALLEGDLGSIRPDWLNALLDPVLRGEADFVSPAFSRAVSEGTLTTNLLAPLTRGLYGGGLQQVMGGCAAVAGTAFGSWLPPGAEMGTEHPHGTEIEITTAALAAGARIVEVHLGRKVAAPGGLQPDLATILVRTVGTLFDLMERHEAAWISDDRHPPVPRRGAPEVHPDARPLDVERMVRAFDLGLKDLLPIWEQIIPEATLADLYPLGLLAADEFRLPPRLWARIVGDFSVAHHGRRLPRDHLLRALTPLYLGRVAAFILEARATPLERMSGIFETIDRAFEDEREFLVARWR
jgi:hypothetical protein